MEDVKWKRGQKAELARRTGVSYTYLCDVIAKRDNKQLDADRAAEVQAVCLTMGIKTCLFDWIYSLKTTNPLFGKQEEEEKLS